MQAAVRHAEVLGAIAPGKRVGMHTLRQNYARHLLMNGIPINYLSRWLGHSSLQTTLIYLELVPDSSGSSCDGALRLRHSPFQFTHYSLTALQQEARRMSARSPSVSLVWYLLRRLCRIVGFLGQWYLTEHNLACPNRSRRTSCHRGNPSSFRPLTKARNPISAILAHVHFCRIT